MRSGSSSKVRTGSSGVRSTPAFKSWIALAETDPDAAEKVRRYQHRPAEELFDVRQDWYEWNNLAEHKDYAEKKRELKKALEDWMKSQGDLGQATELAAFERQQGKRNKKNKKTK